jgi:hypothetical protein
MKLMGNPNDAVLGLFARRPVPGQVKTRLASQTSPEFAARAAEAFLHDTIGRFACFGASVVLGCTPDDSAGYFQEVVSTATASLKGNCSHPGAVPQPITIVPQGEGTLGERMQRYFIDRFQDGFRRIILVGSDSPTLPLWIVESAFALLQRADVVLGPSADGGYYLIGLRNRVPPIFAGIRWSTANVLADTVARLEPSTKLALLPPWYDIDTHDDWLMLAGHLRAMQRAGIDPGLPRTLQILETERD